MEATEELTVMTGDKDDEETRLAVAREDACPWLGRILATFIELRFGDDAPGSPKRASLDKRSSLDAIDEDGNNDDDVRSDGALSMMSSEARMQELEQVVINTLQCLINLSRSKKNRKEIADAGCVAPACTLLDLTLRREIHDRAVMLLINCCTGPIQYTGPVHDVVEDSEGVQKLVEMIKLGPDHPTAHRAVQVLSLVSVDPEIKDIFRDKCTGGFEALRAMLERPGGGLFLKHAALTVNHLCDENVPNKIAFMESGGVPAMMRLMDRPPDDPLTAIALDAVTILAEDNDEVDEAVAVTGVLPRVVEMISNPENPKLTQAAVTAVMHMARDYKDAKRMLTTAGVISKLKRIIDECAIEESPESVHLAQMCVSSLTNIAIDTEYWGQSELAEENVLTNVRSVFQSAPAESKMAQVCIAFVYAYTAGNSDNGWTVREAGLLPVVAYHHLRGRDKKTRESKEALVSLGAAVDDDEESQDLVSSLFGETVLRECLKVGAAKGTYVPPENRDEKTRAREKQTLSEVCKIARLAMNGADFAARAKKAYEDRKAKFAQDIFDAEAALERKLVEQLAAREKELKEAENARQELRRAQADAANSRADAKKEINEAKAARFEYDAALRALNAKQGTLIKEKEEARRMIDEKIETYRSESDKLRNMIGVYEETSAEASGDAKKEIERKIKTAKTAKGEYDKRLKPGGCNIVKGLEAQIAELEKRLKDPAIESLAELVKEKEEIWKIEQAEADEAERVLKEKEQAEAWARANAEREEREAKEKKEREEKEKRRLAKEKKNKKKKKKKEEEEEEEEEEAGAAASRTTTTNGDAKYEDVNDGPKVIMVEDEDEEPKKKACCVVM